jgi:CheY-like chemotaxis protein
MNPTLLIGEDEPHLEEILSYVARKLGLEHSIARDGQEVLEKAREMVPDLLLLDLYMPKMNGIDVCRTLKNDPKTSHIYIIMITASAKKEDEDDARSAGTNEFITKPFSPTQLQKRLSEIIIEINDENQAADRENR